MPTPEIKINETAHGIFPSPSKHIQPSDKINVQTYAFLHTAIRSNAFETLSPLERNLIGIYFGCDVSLQDVAEMKWVINPKNQQIGSIKEPTVRKYIRRGLVKMWGEFQPGLKLEYPLESILKLKDPTYRSRFSIQKQTGYLKKY